MTEVDGYIWTMHQVPQPIHTPGTCALQWALRWLSASGGLFCGSRGTPVPSHAKPGLLQASSVSTEHATAGGGGITEGSLTDRVRATTEASYCGKIKRNQGLVLIRDMIFFFLAEFGIICNMLAYRHLLRMKVLTIKLKLYKETPYIELPTHIEYHYQNRLSKFIYKSITFFQAHNFSSVVLSNSLPHSFSYCQHIFVSPSHFFSKTFISN